MAKARNDTQDYTKLMQDMFSAFPMDMNTVQEAFKAQAAFGEKLSRLALDAAAKTTDISGKWTRETIAGAADMARLKADPADYTKAVSGFASAQAELAAENVAALAEVAKTAQMETVDLLLAAGKDLGEDAAAAVKKATGDMAKAAKKAAA